MRSVRWPTADVPARKRQRQASARFSDVFVAVDVVQSHTIAFPQKTVTPTQKAERERSDCQMIGDELRRVSSGPMEGDKSGGVGSVRFVVPCQGDAALVLARAKSVLTIILQQQGENWPSFERWSQLLPKWFVEKCAPETTSEEALKKLAARRTLPADERARLVREEPWELADWIHWFEPDDRCWFWWDGAVVDENHLLVAVEIMEWPFPWGSLAWLFRAAGAVSVAPEKD